MITVLSEEQLLADKDSESARPITKRAFWDCTATRDGWNRPSKLNPAEQFTCWWWGSTSSCLWSTAKVWPSSCLWRLWIWGTAKNNKMKEIGQTERSVYSGMERVQMNGNLVLEWGWKWEIHQHTCCWVLLPRCRQKPQRRSHTCRSHRARLSPAGTLNSTHYIAFFSISPTAEIKKSFICM